jgi:phosphonate transport system substrate-binding protein
MRCRWMAAMMAALCVMVVACGGTSDGAGGGQIVDPDPLVLGFLPSSRASEIVPDAERMGAFLAARLGRRVEVVVPSAYEPLLEGLRFGHVHAAFLDGGPGYIAHQRSGAEVILAEVKDGETFYWAEAFVLVDSPLNDLADLLGQRVAFTSRTGSSGFIMPIGSMIDQGLIRPAGDELTDLERALEEAFASTFEAGGYQQALASVLDGRADVAFGAHDAPARFLDPAQQARMRTLHRFGRIPSHAVLVGGNLSPALVQQLRDALLALNEAENLPLLQAIYGVDGLTPADTESHLGDFGRAIRSLPGMQRTLVEKKPS